VISEWLITWGGDWSVLCGGVGSGMKVLARVAVTAKTLK